MEGLINCNINIILMQASSSTKMTDLEDYDKTNLHIYQKLIGKLIISFMQYKTRYHICNRIAQ